MTRRALALTVWLSGAVACLAPGEPYLHVLDETPPTVVSTRPAVRDAGAAEFPVGGNIEITFSEEMDLRSLRPGIGLYEGQEEKPVLVTAPPANPVSARDPNVPFKVLVTPESGTLNPGGHTLILRTLLTDRQGNALAEEVRVPFVAQ